MFSVVSSQFLQSIHESESRISSKFYRRRLSRRPCFAVVCVFLLFFGFFPHRPSSFPPPPSSTSAASAAAVAKKCLTMHNGTPHNSKSEECPFASSRSQTVLTSCNPYPLSSTSAACACEIPIAASAMIRTRTGWMLLTVLLAAAGTYTGMQRCTRPQLDIPFTSASATCPCGAMPATVTSHHPSCILFFSNSQTRSTSFLSPVPSPLSLQAPPFSPPLLPLPLPHCPLHQARQGAAVVTRTTSRAENG